MTGAATPEVGAYIEASDKWLSEIVAPRPALLSAGLTAPPGSSKARAGAADTPVAGQSGIQDSVSMPRPSAMRLA